MEENKEPNLVSKIKSLTKSLHTWVSKDGMKLTSEEELDKRIAACLNCPHWDQSAYGGAGKCKICGCSSGKWYIPSASCPDKPPRWTSVSGSITRAPQVIPKTPEPTPISLENIT